MGLFLSNFHVRNNNINKDLLYNKFTEIICSKGYRQVEQEETADLSLHFYDPKGNWVSVCSDFFEFIDESSVKNICNPISTLLNTDVLAIGVFDSDFLFLNLINSNDCTDAFAYTGHTTSKKFNRHMAINAWKDKVNNFESFKTAFKEKYVCAENALERIEPALQINIGQALFCPEILSDIKDKENIHTIFFTLSDKSKSDNLPVFKFPVYDQTPCEIDKEKFISAINEGGTSKGIAVSFSCDYVENNEIEFQSVQLEYDLYNYPRKIIPLTLSKIKTADGKWIYYAQEMQFRIPEKVKEGLPLKKSMNEKFQKLFGVSFTPIGNPRKLLDICVHLIPLKNPSAQCCWCVWHNFESKHVFIEMHNNSWSESGAPDIDQLLLDPNDYDM